MTHIRRCLDTSRAVCGIVKPASSISYEHWLERQINPAVAGQIDRLPEGLCGACKQQLEALGV